MSSDDSISSDSSDSEDESKPGPGTPVRGSKGAKTGTPSRKKRNDIEEEGIVSLFSYLDFTFTTLVSK